MRRMFFCAAVGLGFAIGTSASVQAQTMIARDSLSGNDWLKQSVPIPAGTPGFTTPGVASPLDGVGSSPRSDWLRENMQANGYGPNPRVSGFYKQTNGPTTTYNWYWSGANNGSRGMGYQTPTSIGYGMAPATPTLLNPQNLAGYVPGATATRVRSANPFAPFQNTVLPYNSQRPGNFGR